MRGTRAHLALAARANTPAACLDDVLRRRRRGRRAGVLLRGHLRGGSDRDPVRGDGGGELLPRRGRAGDGPRGEDPRGGPCSPDLHPPGAQERPGVLQRYGARVVPVCNYFQAVLVLIEDGLLPRSSARRLLDVLRGLEGVDDAELTEGAHDLVRRGQLRRPRRCVSWPRSLGDLRPSLEALARTPEPGSPRRRWRSTGSRRSPRTARGGKRPARRPVVGER